MLPRPAPIAMRIPISLRRAAARDSSSVARFEQPISSVSATTAASRPTNRYTFASCTAERPERASARCVSRGLPRLGRMKLTIGRVQRRACRLRRDARLEAARSRSARPSSAMSSISGLAKKPVCTRGAAVTGMKICGALEDARAPKSIGGHADDRHGNGVDANGRPDRVRIASQPGPPPAITDHRDDRSVALIVDRGQHSAERRWDAEHVEVVARHEARPRRAPRVPSTTALTRRAGAGDHSVEKVRDVACTPGNPDMRLTS